MKRRFDDDGGQVTRLAALSDEPYSELLSYHGELGNEACRCS